MSTSKSPFSRQVIWENHIHAWQDSGSSKARYCREHKLKYHQFIYWIAKLCPPSRPIKNVISQAPKFLPVTIEHQAVSSGLHIKLPNGVIISGITLDSVAVVGALMAQL